MANTVKKTRESVLPIYGAAAAWAVYAAAFPLYRPSHFVFAALLSGGVLLLLRAVCPVEEISVPEPPEMAVTWFDRMRRVWVSSS